MTASPNRRNTTSYSEGDTTPHKKRGRHPSKARQPAAHSLNNANAETGEPHGIHRVWITEVGGTTKPRYTIRAMASASRHGPGNEEDDLVLPVCSPCKQQKANDPLPKFG